MPTSTPSPKMATTTSSKGDNDGPAASRKAPSGHEQPQTNQIEIDVGGSEAGLPPGLTIPGPITKTVECNMMSYTDGEGITRQIYMPKGTAGLASTLLMDKRWDSLAKFPVWNNQTYDDWEADEEKYAYLRDELDDHPNQV
ncbi:hypothetical protein J7T55_007527 [Diaporthe amygdali]|uniref:uncharacterized protein n=1 Tax=Phomopsis amygdali TaxID=1214568 RepID=UPI0022FECF58|nr:uncharacterized protein J7T55_007527 [Diaporthe amygdali]KAJ0116547.1 hypothetical protein J7T55_007527 [Diaporthe amygdali]